MSFIDEAIKIAKRSSQKNYKTGAVLVQNGVILSNGWSHVPEFSRLRSMHAEIHALARARHLPIKNMTDIRMYVATLRHNGNLVSARPCLNCAVALRSVGIFPIHFTLSNDWNDYINLTSNAHFDQLKVYPQDPLDE